jgi:tRNA G18 (ribose-2'-O)-methylase SpoU
MRPESIADAGARHPDVLEWFTALKDVALRTSTEPEHGIFIAEGETVIRRAHAAGYRLLAVLAEPRWIDLLGDLLTDDVIVMTDSPVNLAELTGYHVHRGALAAFARRPLPEPEDVLSGARRALFIEGMVNHTNVGAIFRSAAAMRMDAIIVDSRCADPLYRRAIRTSMGTVFQMPWTRGTQGNLTGFTTVALMADPQARDIRSVDWAAIPRIALLVGTEGSGLAAETFSTADFRVVIPMNEGIDSLNAASATAVACYEITRSLP